MNTALTFCAIFITGWVSPEFMEPIAPMPENSPPRILPAAEKLPQRQSHPQLADARPARAANEEFVRPMRMPVAPTDPRVFSRSDLPLPPTMSDSGMLPSTVRPRLNTAVSGDNGGRRLPPQKVFENYRACADAKSLRFAECQHRQRHDQSLHGLCTAATGATGQSVGEGGERLGEHVRSTCPQLPAGLPELRFVLSGAVGSLCGKAC